MGILRSIFVIGGLCLALAGGDNYFSGRNYGPDEKRTSYSSSLADVNCNEKHGKGFHSVIFKTGRDEGAGFVRHGCLFVEENGSATLTLVDCRNDLDGMVREVYVKGEKWISVNEALREGYDAVNSQEYFKLRDEKVDEFEKRKKYSWRK